MAEEFDDTRNEDDSAGPHDGEPAEAPDLGDDTEGIQEVDEAAGDATEETQAADEAAGDATEGTQAADEVEWYYAIDGKSYGPVTESELKALARQGHFGMKDHVYSTFVGDWVSADSVYGLFEEAGVGIAPAAGVVIPPGLGLPQGLALRTAYAGFWVRFVAVLIDGLVLLVPTCINAALFQGIIVAVGFGHQGTSGGGAMAAGGILLVVLQNIIAILIAWLYYSLMESSKWQATLGKRAMSVFVTDLEGRRISFTRATGRHFASILSGLILSIGYIMGAFTERKQTLHDMIAGTVVVVGRTG